MRPTRWRTAGIAISLVICASVLSALSAGVLPLYSAAQPRPSTLGSSTSSFSYSSQSSSSSAAGVLAVQTLLSGSDGHPAPLADASVVVTAIGFGPFQYRLDTNSSGEVQVPLDAGNYSVSLSAPGLRATAEVEVYQGQTTELDLVGRQVQSQSLLDSASIAPGPGGLAL